MEDLLEKLSIAAAVAPITWTADLGSQKSPGDDAAALRALREDIDATRERLAAAIARLAEPEAQQIERLVARLLHDAMRVWQLSPLPTPNVRRRIAGEAPQRMRRAKAATPRAQAVNRACEAEFAKLLKGWDGGQDVWKQAVRAARRINAALSEQNLPPLSDKAVYDRLVKRLRSLRAK